MWVRRTSLFGELAPGPHRLTRRRAVGLLLVLLAAAAAAAALALALGSSRVPVASLWSDDPALAPARDILLNLRLPRVLSAFAVGGLLALAGALMQILLRNPLADPYVLGVSGGAGVGALAVIFFVGTGWWVNLGAAAGALAAIALVFVLARGDGSWSQARLLLTGVALASFSGAMISLLLSIAPDGILRGMVFWLLGDLASADSRLALAALAVSMLLVLPLARDLNILALRAAQAATLGVAVPRLRRAIYLLSALATAAAVVTGGMIGFVGLIVPHAVRLVFGNDQRLLLPASALVGGTALMLADLAARTLVAPQQLPVGVVTAAVGAPCFLILLNRRMR